MKRKEVVNVAWTKGKKILPNNLEQAGRIDASPSKISALSSTYQKTIK